MDKLWKKESSADDANYIDLYLNVREMDIYNVIKEQMSIRPKLEDLEKSDRLAVMYRNQGNKLYAQEKMDKAIESYNSSIAFAENNSENLGYAYGNRSLCFYDMKMFSKCLSDIQYALDSNYPREKRDKLEKRREMCLRQLDSEVQLPELSPKLSFRPNPAIPGMANNLKICHNTDLGRHVITNSDIEIGQTILIERPLIDVQIGNEYNRCSTCMKKFLNLIACKNCVVVMNCIDCWENDNYHDYECNMFKLLYWENDDGLYRNMLQIVIRMILYGITNMTIDEMNALVVKSVNDPKYLKDFPIARQTPRSKFETFLKLYPNISKKSAHYDTCVQLACLSYDLLFKCNRIRETFRTLKDQRFLMHLSLFFLFISKSNRTVMAEYVGFKSIYEHTEYFSMSLYNVKAFINHSCMPNVATFSYDNVMVCKAIRPIKKGEQLFIDYIEYDVDSLTNRDQLLSVYGFECNCPVCTGGLLQSQRLMKDDVNYKFIEANIHRVRNDKNMEKTLVHRAKLFLNKWGGMKPSKELITVQQYLTALLQSLKDECD